MNATEVATNKGEISMLGWRDVGAISLEGDSARFFDVLVMNSLFQKILGSLGSWLKTQ
jgi:hypothetical protein